MASAGVKPLPRILLIYGVLRGLLFLSCYALAGVRLAFVVALGDLLLLVAESAVWQGQRAGAGGRAVGAKKPAVYIVLVHVVPSLLRGYPFAPLLVGSKWWLAAFLRACFCRGVHNPAAWVAVAMGCVVVLLPFLAGFMAGPGLEGAFLESLEVVGPYLPLQQLAQALGMDLQRELATIYATPYGDSIAFQAAAPGNYLLVSVLLGLIFWSAAWCLQRMAR